MWQQWVGGTLKTYLQDREERGLLDFPEHPFPDIPLRRKTTTSLFERASDFEPRGGPTTDVMQPGPAVSTRARAALGDISNRGLAGGLAGKAGGKVRRPPVPNYPAPGN